MQVMIHSARPLASPSPRGVRRMARMRSARSKYIALRFGVSSCHCARIHSAAAPRLPCSHANASKATRSRASAGVCVVSLFIFASAATLARLEKGEAMSRDLARCAYHSTGQSQANPPQPSIPNSKSWPSMASPPPMASNACIVGRVSPCPTTSRPSTSNSTCAIEPMTTTSLSVPRMAISPVGGVGVKVPRLRAAHDLEVGLAVDHVGDVGCCGPCRLVAVAVVLLALDALGAEALRDLQGHVLQLDEGEPLLVPDSRPVARGVCAPVAARAVEVVVADVGGDEVPGLCHGQSSLWGWAVGPPLGTGGLQHFPERVGCPILQEVHRTAEGAARDLELHDEVVPVEGHCHPWGVPEGQDQPLDLGVHSATSSSTGQNP